MRLRDRLGQAIAAAKGKALALPLGLFGAAFIFALAAVMALAVGVVIALSRFIGPLAAGFVGLLIFAVIGGGCAWYGYQRFVRDLSRTRRKLLRRASRRSAAGRG